MTIYSSLRVKKVKIPLKVTKLLNTYNTYKFFYNISYKKDVVKSVT